MQMLMTKLEEISAETGDGQKASPKESGDEFVRIKKQVANNIRDVRTKLTAREELLSKGAAGSKATVQASHQIRQQLKQSREDANKLLALQRKEASKTKGKEKAVEQAENRQEVVELIFKNIEECELQEKKRYTSKNSEARVELFAAGGRGGGSRGPTSTGPAASGGAGPSGAGSTSLPDIDAETQEGLQLLKKKDQAIDDQLEMVAEGVSELKSLALNMRDEVKVQSAMVDEITTKVDAASTHLNSINKRMKQTLAQTRSADRFILDVILLVVLLAIVGYIVSMFTGS